MHKQVGAPTDAWVGERSEDASPSEADCYADLSREQLIYLLKERDRYIAKEQEDLRILRGSVTDLNLRCKLVIGCVRI